MAQLAIIILSNFMHGGMQTLTHCLFRKMTGSSGCSITSCLRAVWSSACTEEPWSRPNCEEEEEALAMLYQASGRGKRSHNYAELERDSVGP